MSYNLEANYALVTKSTDYTQGFYDKIFFINGVNRTETAARMESINFFSRNHFYRMIEDKMNEYGMNGNFCLKRVICEAAKSDFIERNGVFGSLLHILLTPSESKHESNMDDYIAAEKHGLNGNCIKYKKNCSLNILNLFSKIV